MNSILIGYDSELLDIIVPFKPHVRLTIKAENGLDFEKICGANSIGFGYLLLAVETLQKAHISYNITLMSEFVNSNKLHCRGDEEESLTQYTGTNKRMRERGVWQ